MPWSAEGLPSLVKGNVTNARAALEQLLTLRDMAASANTPASAPTEKLWLVPYCYWPATCPVHEHNGFSPFWLARAQVLLELRTSR